MRVISALAALLVAMFLVACGDDDAESGGDGATESGLVGQPEPAASVDEQTEQLNTALAEDDCRAFAGLTFTFLRPPGTEAGAPGTPEECKNVQQFLDDFAGVEFDESAEFGTVAVTQGDLPEEIGGYDTGIAVWELDWDGNFRHVSIYPGDPLIDSEPVEGADPQPVIDGFIEAARTGDCSNADEVFHEGALFAEPGSTPTEQCKSLVGGKIFAPAIKETEEPEVEQLGETLDLIFYGVSTEEAYFTVTLSTPFAQQQGSLSEDKQADFTVVDVLANTEVELPPPPKDESEKG